jgi:hypothetical protein
MRNTIRWALLAVGFVVLGFAFYAARLDHELGVSVNGEIDRHFATAGAQVKVLDGRNAPAQVLSERDRALMGQAAVSEYLMSFRIAGYHTKHGAFPASLEEADSHNPGRQPSSLDPWGNSFRLLLENTDRFLIISGGPSGTSVLTAEERDAILSQPVGRTYQLHGKIVFNGGLVVAHDQNEQKSTTAHVE